MFLSCSGADSIVAVGKSGHGRVVKPTAEKIEREEEKLFVRNA
jgi:hypothetical protein